MSDLYKRIESLCLEKKISITTMCKESGASRASLSDLKVGRKQKLSADTLSKIAAYFGVSVDFLLGVESSEWCNRFRCQLGKVLETVNHADLISAGINFHELSLIAEGNSTLSFDRACEISDALGVSFDFMLGKEKAPTASGERSVSDDELKFALWGNCEDISDDDLADVRRYAAFVRERKKDKK